MQASFENYVGAINAILDQTNRPQQEIQQANNFLYQLKESNTSLFLIYSSRLVLLDDATDIQATVGINSIKSVIRQTRFYGIDHITEVWNSIPQDQRIQLKQALIKGIIFERDDLRNSASSTLALIAQLEFPTQWPDFFDVLASVCQQNSGNSFCIMGVLQTLGDCFLDPNFIRPRHTKAKAHALQMVTSLAYNVLSQNCPPVMKSGALYMLYNSFKTSFHIIYTMQTDLIMPTFQPILANFNVEDETLHSFIYEFFTVTFQKLYDKLYPSPIDAIIQLVSTDLVSGNMKKAKMALKFIKKCAKKDLEKVSIEDTNLQCFSKVVGQNITVTIIPFLAFISDTFSFDEGDDSLSFITYGALKNLAFFNREETFSIVQAYFGEKKADPDPRVRISAILALKSILKIQGPVPDYINSVFSDIISLTQDRELIVSLYAQSFVASFIKKNIVLNDQRKDAEFIINISSQLLQANIPQAINGCKILINFIKRYNDTNTDSPLGDTQIFESILRPLWNQFSRDNIANSKLDNAASRTINLLSQRSPYQTLEIRRGFCLEVLERFRANAELLAQKRADPDLCHIQFILLEIFGNVLYSIRAYFDTSNTDDPFINDLFQYFSQFLPRMGEIPNLVKTMGNLIITAPQNSFRFAETLIQYLMAAQQSGNPDLICESALTLGDLFRSAKAVMLPYEHDFCNILLTNIEKDDLPNMAVSWLIMSLADLVSNTEPMVIIEFRDRLVNLVRNYTHNRYNPDDPGDVAIMSSFFEGIIYLSGGILKTFSNDEAFITNRVVISILFEFKWHIKPEVFKSDALDSTIILFVQNASENPKAARIYNIELNHNNIRSYLEKIVKKNKNIKFKEKAKKLISKIYNS